MVKVKVKFTFDQLFSITSLLGGASQMCGDNPDIQERLFMAVAIDLHERFMKKLVSQQQSYSMKLKEWEGLLITWVVSIAMQFDNTKNDPYRYAQLSQILTMLDKLLITQG